MFLLLFGPGQARRMRAIATAWLLLSFIAGTICSNPHAAAADTDFGALSLEQLGTIQVRSMRRAERLSDTAASIFVISADDIRRSAATSLPEVLRLAPNLEVARADANQYAITARGFNSVLANKLLVMIDGRTVYSPLFSGVFWEAQDLRLADIDRIEVVSGPGGILWGTNAVGGVINIITRTAGQTPGLAAMAQSQLLPDGPQDRSADVRFGGTAGPGGHFRVYGRILERDDTENVSGNSIIDAATRTQGGFRSDWETGPHQLTLQGDAYRSDIDQFDRIRQIFSRRRISGLNLLGSWTRQLGGNKNWRLQAYYDRNNRNQPGSITEALDTFDAEAQCDFRPFSRHDILVGGGFRYQHDDVTNLTPDLAFLPAGRTLRYANVYIEDDIRLTPRLNLIAGSKIEHNDFTDFEYLPGVRLAWKPADELLLWGGFSRAVRAPSRIDRELFFPANPPHSFLAGGAAFESEISNVLEAGVRSQASLSASYAVTVFHHRNRKLRSLEPSAAGPVFGNGIQGTNTGVEAWGSWRIFSSWRIQAGMVQQNQELEVAPGATALGGVAGLGNDPAQWWTFRSAHNFGPRVELDVMVREVGALPAPHVPSYTACDARVACRVRRSFELAISAQNLFDARHAEWGVGPGRPEFERSVFVTLLWAE